VYETENMSYSIGDGMAVTALAAAFLGYQYLKHRDRLARLEIVHQERLAAMEKGIPLPEFSLDPPTVERRPDPNVPLILGIVLATFGMGSMIALGIVSDFGRGRFWPMPLPLALVGFGLMLYHFLTTNRES
jgi:hypothetical protein